MYSCNFDSHLQHVDLLLIDCVFYQVVNALEYLHSEMHVIHRDVKPSNILLNRAGDIKLCDYSISGYLVNSLAVSMGVGFYPYMAVSPFFIVGIVLFLKLLC